MSFRGTLRAEESLFSWHSNPKRFLTSFGSPRTFSVNGMTTEGIFSTTCSLCYQERITSNRVAAEMFQKFPRSLELFEALFFGAEFGGVRLKPACGGAQGMLHMEHFVIKDQFDGIRGHMRAIQSIVHNDLIEGRVEAAILGAPGARTPTQARAAEVSFKVFKIERREHRIERSEERRAGEECRSRWR